jgi:tRNA dimethylallyltransferase
MFHAGSAEYLLALVTLRIDGRGQIGMVDAPAGRSGDRRPCVKSDAEAGGLEHRQIVGAVAKGKNRAWCDAQSAGEREQCPPLGFAAHDRRQNAAGQALTVHFQAIGDDPADPEPGRNRFGENCEAAGRQRGFGAGAPHRSDQRCGAGGKANSGCGLGENPDIGAGQQRDPGGHRAGEVDFAVHRSPGDLGDFRADPKDQSEFVEHFVFDDRRFEIGNEETLAPPGDGLQQPVDRFFADNRTHSALDCFWVEGIEEDVAGLFGRQPDGLGGDTQNLADRGGNPGEAMIATSRDQTQDKLHRPLSYPGSALRHKVGADAQPVLIIAGPTACGKSALASALAGQLNGTVINADALQCYRDLEILTARPDSQAQAPAPHRLYGFLDAAERGSVGAWRSLALAETAAAAAAGRLPIMVGGTGLYLHALQHGLASFPEIPEAIREEAQALHRALGSEAFRARLALLDPASAQRLPAGDTQRLVRAYAVVRATGIPIGTWRDQPHAHEPRRFATILLMPPREIVYRSCNTRFLAMLDKGALAEAEALAARSLDPGLPAMKAVGLPELLAHLRGKITLAEATLAAQRSTRRYAKRQITWFRHQLHPDLVITEQFSESLLRCSRHFIDEFLLTPPG